MIATSSGEQAPSDQRNRLIMANIPVSPMDLLQIPLGEADGQIKEGAITDHETDITE